jgi:hypothetical protein
MKKFIATVFVLGALNGAVGTAHADGGCVDGSTCFHCVCPCNGCAPGDYESGQGGS